MSSPGNNPPHAPGEDPAQPRRQDAHDAKIEAKAAADQAHKDSPQPWYKRLFGAGVELDQSTTLLRPAPSWTRRSQRCHPRRKTSAAVRRPSSMPASK